MHFHRTTLADIQNELPSLIDTQALLDRGAEFDVLICVNGFEDRSTAVPQWLSDNAVSVRRSIVLTYPSNTEDNGRTSSALQDALVNVEERTTMQTGAPEPELRAQIQSQLRAACVGGLAKVILDVSGASGRIILRAVRTLFDFARESEMSIELTIAYAEAEHYAPTQEDAEALIAAIGNPEAEATLGLDFDAEELAPSVEYPGQHLDKVVDRVVVICGFNAVRVRAALDHMDSAFNTDFPHARVTYIAGMPPKPERQWRYEAMVQINSQPDREPLVAQQASTLDYLETLRRLEAQYRDSFGAERLTVIPFGSKMQTIATALFCELHRDVRVQLVAPARYAGAEYTTGIGPMHFLPVGNLGSLIDLLGQVDRIVELGTTTAR